MLFPFQISQSSSFSPHFFSPPRPRSASGSKARRPNPIANHRRRRRLRLLPALPQTRGQSRPQHPLEDSAAAAAQRARRLRGSVRRSTRRHASRFLIPRLHCAASRRREPHRLLPAKTVPPPRRATSVPGESTRSVSSHGRIPIAPGLRDSWIRRRGLRRPQQYSTAPPLSLLWQRTPASTVPSFFLFFFSHGD